MPPIYFKGSRWFFLMGFFIFWHIFENWHDLSEFQVFINNTTSWLWYTYINILFLEIFFGWIWTLGGLLRRYLTVVKLCWVDKRHIIPATFPQYYGKTIIRSLGVFVRNSCQIYTNRAKMVRFDSNHSINKWIVGINIHWCWCW